jgi:tRNA(His) 5'-end guanylyltransferase
MSQKYKNDELGTRMKGYESVSKTKLLNRTPVIIRIDGKAFHTWTKVLPSVDESLLNDPFSDVMHKCMVETTQKLVKNIQNAVIGYTQSDEITILLNDWKTLTTDQWFGNSVQKMASVSASMATAYFNRAWESMFWSDKIPPALFDARVFNIPKEEVTNNFIWRQQDATRNSINMYARHFFSHKEMQNKSTSEVQDMLMLEKGVNWNDLETWKRRGTCTVRGSLEKRLYPGNANEWAVQQPHNEVVVDEEIPIFTQDREYIDMHLRVDND